MDMTKNAKDGSEFRAPQVSPGTYSPITVYNQDSLGTLFLGLIALVLLTRFVNHDKRYFRNNT